MVSIARFSRSREVLLPDGVIVVAVCEGGDCEPSSFEAALGVLFCESAIG